MAAPKKPNPAPKNGKSGETGEANKALTPRKSTIARQMEKFLVDLRSNGGIVSKALKSSGPSNATAYNRFASDPDFRAKWLEAEDFAGDELFTEAITRATKGELEPVYQGGKKVGTIRRKSDTLLIYLMKRHDNKRMIKRKLIEIGQRSLKALKAEGQKAGLSIEQIIQIESAIIDELNKVTI
jgi:hypothetical protein